MADKPTADELLMEVLRSLKEDILPGLEGKQRFTGLMMANALGIARREIANEARRSALLDSGLSGLGIGGPADAVRGLRQARLGGRQDLYDLLLEDAELRTAIASPQAMKE